MMIKRVLVLLTFIIVIAPFTLAYDLSYFPEPFIENGKFNVVGVIGVKSQDSDVLAILKVFDILSQNYNISWRTKVCPEGDTCIGINLPMPPYEIRLDEDIPNISKNIISIGGPCANKITAQIMDLPTTWPECAYEFKEGEGRIIIYDKLNRTQIIVAGYTENDTRNAAKILANRLNYNLIGNDVIVNESLQTAMKEKYYDWRIWFVIYKSAGKVVEFASDGEFELTKQAILSVIQPTEYDINSFNISYHGIDNWYTGGEKTGKKNGFRIDVTQRGYKDIISEIKDSGYLKSIYFNVIIDPRIQRIPENEEEIANCKFDRECIKVSGDCCGCSSGGTSTTINRAYYNYWNNKSKEKCKGIACIAVISKHWTCFAEPKCIGNKCNLVSKEVLPKEKCENPKDWIIYLKEETGGYYKTYLKIIELSDVNLTEETHFIGKLNAGCEGIGTERCPLYRLDDIFLYVMDNSLREHIGKTVEVIGKEVIIEGNNEIEIWPNKIRVCSS